MIIRQYSRLAEQETLSTDRTTGVHAGSPHGRELIGFCFTPQDGNPLLSTVAALLWYLDEETREHKLDILRRYLFTEI